MEKLAYIDAFNIIVKYLQHNIEKILQFRNVGYTHTAKPNNEFGLEEIFPETFKINEPSYINYNIILDAINTLCRMGIARKSTGPLLKTGQPDIGSVTSYYLPYRYALTEQGIAWIKNIDSENSGFIYTSPHHFSEILSKFSPIFGGRFSQTAHEACNCYISHLYLACCVMSGISAEIVFIKAYEVVKNKEITLEKYLKTKGMWDLKENILNVLKNDKDKKKLNSFSGLIIDYRNDNAHSFNKKADEFVAYDSLSRLIRLCRFMEEKWIELKIAGQAH